MYLADFPGLGIGHKLRLVVPSVYVLLLSEDTLNWHREFKISIMLFHKVIIMLIKLSQLVTWMFHLNYLLI